MRKKWMIGVLSAALGTASLTSIGPVAVYGQTEQVYIQSEAAQVLEVRVRDDVSGVAFRQLMESRGFEVLWDTASKSVSAQKNGFVVQFNVEQAQFDWSGNDQGFGEQPSGWLDANRLYISTDTAKLLLEAYDRQHPRLQEVRVMIPGEMDQPDIIRTNDDRYAEKLGITVQVQQVPLQHYRDRLNVMAAAGDMSDLSYIADKRQLEAFVENGLLEAMDDEWLQAPEWQKYLAEALGADYAQRPLYGIPVVGEAEGSFPWINQAWLTRAGVAQPQTLEELLSVLTDMQESAEAEDHYVLGGYVGGIDLGGLQWVEQAFNGQPSRFVVRDGQLVDTLLSPATRKALGWLQQAYRDGLIDPEFAVRSQAAVEKMLEDGAIGVTGLDWVTGAAFEAYQPHPVVQGEDENAVVFADNRIAGWYVLSPRTDRARMGQVLRDALLTSKTTLGGQSLQVHSPISTRLGELDLDAARSKELLEVRQAELASIQAADVVDPVESLVLTRYNNDIAQMDKQIQEMKIKVIMGAASLEEWMVFVEELASGVAYQSMVEQLNRAYTGVTPSGTDQPQSEQPTPITIMVSTPNVTDEQFRQLSVLPSYAELGISPQWQQVKEHFAEKLKTMIAAGMTPDVVMVEDAELYEQLGQTGAFLTGADWRDLESEGLVIPDADGYGIPRYDEDGEQIGWIMISAMSRDLKAIERFLTYSTSGEDDDFQAVFEEMFGFGPR